MTITRTSKTEEHYESKARQICHRAARELGYELTDSVSPIAVSEHLITRKPEIARNTWKLYKNALRSHFRALADDAKDAATEEELRAAIALLDAEPSTGALRRGIRTSATKQKQFKRDDFDQLLEYLTEHVGRHKFANALRTWLLASRFTGLRPCEWEDAGLTDADGRPCLIVRNAKATNGRGNGSYRTLDLSKASIANINALYDMMEMLEGYEADLGFSALQERLADYMKRATRSCFGRRKKYPTLYSLRHQFVADAKRSGHSQAEVAAMLGQASDETATRHYARAVSGESAVNVAPIAAEVSRVRKKAREYRRTKSPSPR
jgi:integrase